MAIESFTAECEEELSGAEPIGHFRGLLVLLYEQKENPLDCVSDEIPFHIFVFFFVCQVEREGKHSSHRLELIRE